MEALNQTAVGNLSNSGDSPKPKKTKRVFAISTLDRSNPIPGANIPTAKKAEPGLDYYFNSYIPITEAIGNPAEAIRGYGFASDLNLQAKSKGIGFVTKVTLADGVCEVVLKLTVNGDQANHLAPATTAYAHLESFLTNAPQLCPDMAGKQATWKAKVNGTTILDGKYLANSNTATMGVTS